MSKHVKELITQELRNRLEGVSDAFLVHIGAMTANDNAAFRRELRAKNVQVMVIKNSLARRATEGTPLAAAFQGLEGSTALVWGAEDVVSLAKILKSVGEAPKYSKLETRGGVLDGAQLSADEAKAVAKWPNRAEQLSILVGQILSPGANLASQLLGPGGALASQIKQKAESEGEAAEA